MSLSAIKDVNGKPSFNHCTASNTENSSNNQAGYNHKRIAGSCMGEIYSRPDTPADIAIATNSVPNTNHSAAATTTSNNSSSSSSSSTMASVSGTSQSTVLTSSPTKFKVKMKSSEEEEEDECVICLDEKDDRTIVTPCMHEFCYECIKRWININPECPLCKRAIVTLLHKILSDSDYQEEKLPNRMDRIYRLFGSSRDVPLDFDLPLRVGGQLSHVVSRIRPGMLYLSNSSGMVFGPSHNDTFQQIFSRLFAPGELIQIRPFIYLLRLQSQFREQQMNVREFSPEFFRVNHPALYRLAPFMSRDLRNLNIADSENLTSNVMDQLIMNRIEDSSMTRFLSSTPLARYALIFQHEVEMFARYTSTLEDYDQAVNFYSSENNLVYSGSTGVVDNTLTNLLLQTVQTLRITPREMFNNHSIFDRLIYMGATGPLNPEEYQQARRLVAFSLLRSMNARAMVDTAPPRIIHQPQSSIANSTHLAPFHLRQPGVTNRSSRLGEAMTQYSQRLNEVSNDLRRLSHRITLASTRMPERSRPGIGTQNLDPPTYNFFNESRLNSELLPPPRPSNPVVLNLTTSANVRDSVSQSIPNTAPILTRSDSVADSGPINLTTYSAGSHPSVSPDFLPLSEPLSMNMPSSLSRSGSSLFTPLPRPPQDVSRTFDDDWDFLNRPFASSAGNSHSPRIMDLSRPPMNTRIEVDITANDIARSQSHMRGIRPQQETTPSPQTHFTTTVSPTPPGSPRLVSRPGFSVSPQPDAISMLSFRIPLLDRLSPNIQSVSPISRDSDSPTDCLVTHVTRDDRPILIESSSSSSNNSRSVSPERATTSHQLDHNSFTTSSVNRPNPIHRSFTLARKNKVRFTILRERFTENRIKRMLQDNNKSDQHLPLKKRRLITSHRDRARSQSRGKLGYISDSSSNKDNSSDDNSSSSSSPIIKSVIGAVKGKPLSFSHLEIVNDDDTSSHEANGRIQKYRNPTESDSDNGNVSIDEDYKFTPKKSLVNNHGLIEEIEKDSIDYDTPVSLGADDKESTSLLPVARSKSLFTSDRHSDSYNESPIKKASTSRNRSQKMATFCLELVTAADPIVISSDDDDSDDLVMGEVIPPSITLSNNEDELESLVPSSSLQHPQPELMDVYEPDNEDDFYRVLQESLGYSTFRSEDVPPIANSQQ